MRPIGAAGSLLRGVISGSGSYLSGLGRVLVADSKKAVSAGQARMELGRGQEDSREGGEAGRQGEQGEEGGQAGDGGIEEYNQRELEEFDRQMRQREGQRRQDGAS